MSEHIDFVPEEEIGLASAEPVRACYEYSCQHCKPLTLGEGQFKTSHGVCELSGECEYESRKTPNALYVGLLGVIAGLNRVGTSL